MLCPCCFAPTYFVKEFGADMHACDLCAHVGDVSQAAKMLHRYAKVHPDGCAVTLEFKKSQMTWYIMWLC